MTELEPASQKKTFTPNKFQKAIILILVNLISLSILVYGFEFYLKLTDPFLTKLPFDTSYYNRHQIFYPNMESPKKRITWGHIVDYHDVGGRGEEVEVPKPNGVCQIAVLGDSLTFGMGLALEERFSNRVDASLAEHFPEQTIKLINMGKSGASTIDEKEKLLKHGDAVDPGLIIVAFVFNDPQPRSQNYSGEREDFYKKNGPLIEQVSLRLVKLGLPEVAKNLKRAIDNYSIKSGKYPAWEDALQRTYETDSQEWQDFVQALQDIKENSDARGLPAPIFMVLNQQIYLDTPTAYTDMSLSLPLQLRWYHQAEMAAEEIGFRTFNYEAEFLENLTPEEIPVNELDQHPSAKVNKVYADKLFDFLVEDIESGATCNSGIE